MQWGIGSESSAFPILKTWHKKLTNSRERQTAHPEIELKTLGKPVSEKTSLPDSRVKSCVDNWYTCSLNVGSSYRALHFMLSQKAVPTTAVGKRKCKEVIP